MSKSALVASLAKSVLPPHWYERIRASRSRAYQLGLLKSLGLIKSAEQYLKTNGPAVRHGPFSGMAPDPEAPETKPE